MLLHNAATACFVLLRRAATNINNSRATSTNFIPASLRACKQS